MIFRFKFIGIFFILFSSAAPPKDDLANLGSFPKTCHHKETNVIFQSIYKKTLNLREKIIILKDKDILFLQDQINSEINYLKNWYTIGLGHLGPVNKSIESKIRSDLKHYFEKTGELKREQRAFYLKVKKIFNSPQVHFRAQISKLLGRKIIQGLSHLESLKKQAKKSYVPKWYDYMIEKRRELEIKKRDAQIRLELLSYSYEAHYALTEALANSFKCNNKSATERDVADSL